MGYPAGLEVVEHPPPQGWGGGAPIIVMVHGSLDRGSSFTRTVRRLAEWGVVTYDRRGYQGSRDGSSPADLGAHVEDLLGVVAGIPGSGGRVDGGRVDGGRVTAVGHSLGGDVVLAAAIQEQGLFGSVAVYEPPMPWLGIRRTTGSASHPAPPATAGADDPASRSAPPATAGPDEEVERFFRRMVGDAAWERLPVTARAQRRADGPALVADLAALAGSAPFDVTALSVPAVFGCGGPQSRAHHRDTVAWLAANVPGSVLVEIEGAGHGAHLTHPDGFAAMVRTAVRLASGSEAGDPEPPGDERAVRVGTLDERKAV